MRVIDLNLYKEALDEAGREKTLLPDEKCKYCGREITTYRAMQRHDTVCGVCQSDIRRLKRLRCRVTYGDSCNLLIQDPDFNKGHGKRFFDAMDRSITRGDFR